MKPNKVIAYTIGVIMLMELIDGSALNTALPQIANSFEINPITLKVAITVYLLSLGLFIPASSWLSDRLGGKRILIISVTGFILTSAACGLSTNLVMLVIFRALQGMFGAFTMPVARLAMVRIFKGNMIAAMSVIAVVVTIGPMLGPSLGGFITTYIGWRAIFFINLPVGILAIILVYYFLPNFSQTKAQSKFDIKGFLILGTAIASFMLFVDLLLDSHIHQYWKWLSLCIAICLGFLYLKHAKKFEDKAVINLHILKNDCFRYFTIISTLSRLTIMGMMFVFPLYLQTKQGYSAFESGLATMAFIIPSWLIKKAVGTILNYLHFYRFYLITFLLMIGIFLGIAFTFIHFNLIVFLTLLACLGACFGAYTIISNAGVYNAIDNDDHMGDATVIISTVIQLSSAFAISWVGIVLAYLSGTSDLSFHSVIPDSAFAITQLCYAIGLSLTLLYIYKCQPKDLIKISIT
ncbi:MFS transporter [Francisellaceae bacterium]|nr:MFS transporter [Francisellaceae bacterium]